MSEESVKEDQILKFEDKVKALRNDTNCANMRPDEIVSTASRNLSLYSAVMELSCAGLCNVVMKEAYSLEDVQFWIAAVSGVSFQSGGLKKDWLEAFNMQFFGKFTGVRDLPSPYDLKLSSNVASRFYLMLQAAVAIAESKGKVGKVANNKVLGFRAIKYWSESSGWKNSEDGFTAKDREILKALLERGGTNSNQTDIPITASNDDLADMRTKYEASQKELNLEKSKNLNYANKIQNYEKDLENRKQEINELQKDKEFYYEKAESLETRIKTIEEERSFERQQFESKKSSLQDCISEMQRKIANSENRFKEQNDSIASVISPIRQQLEDGKGMEMTIKLGQVLRTHLDHVIDVLHQNGFEI